MTSRAGRPADAGGRLDDEIREREAIPPGESLPSSRCRRRSVGMPIVVGSEREGGHRPAIRPSRDLLNRPSAIRMRRAARSDATFGSWVITISVRPSAFSSSNSSITSPDVVLVEVAGGLVGEQHARPADHRPGHGDPLPLAAGQRAGQKVDAVTQSDAIERLPRPCLRARPRGTPL